MLFLRELGRADMPAVNGWRADRDQVRCLGAPFRYVGAEVDERWFDAYLECRSSTVRCVVADTEDSEVVLGLVTLAGIDWVHRSCVFHIQVAPESQGCGVGRFALEEMLLHAFDDLGMNRVGLHVLASNVRARALYRDAGFVEEGVVRQAVYKEGCFVDMIAMGLLSEEWRAQRKNIR